MNCMPLFHCLCKLRTNLLRAHGVGGGLFRGYKRGHQGDGVSGFGGEISLVVEEEGEIYFGGELGYNCKCNHT